MTGANMNFMQPVTASYTGHDLDLGIVPSALAFRLHHSSEHTRENKIKMINKCDWNCQKPFCISPVNP